MIQFYFLFSLCMDVMNFIIPSIIFINILHKNGLYVSEE